MKHGFGIYHWPEGDTYEVIFKVRVIGLRIKCVDMEFIRVKMVENMMLIYLFRGSGGMIKEKGEEFLFGQTEIDTK